MIKKIFTFILIITATSLSSQRFGYVDTDFVLKKLPQYKKAQEYLVSQTKEWADEIAEKKEALAKSSKELEVERVLLTKEQLNEIEVKLAEQKSEIKKLEEERYGADGDLIKVRINLMKPIQDRIYNSVKAVAIKRNYSFVFDKGSDLILIYTDPKYDISREVLKVMTNK